ncbi:NAD(P)-binding domain-containing protein [Croceimicrobium sp.]|uniref:NAD(P)-binding domain-containing protein n=1 Tax=Croceimicrobium sp. TaxID=2828340 RepID=UPI003BA9B8E9
MWEVLIYGFVILLSGTIVWYYWSSGQKRSKEVAAKVVQAQEEGRYQPVSLHPYIDPHKCIGSGACVRACPEEDILGLIDGKGTLINASSCIGHGACFHACPVDAISLRIGTEVRGVDLPHIKPNYETNISGIYIAGELGGMGLIKNSAEQGVQACNNLAEELPSERSCETDVVIIGAGPAGIAAALKAKEKGLSFRVLEQDSLGGTVFTFPRDKVVMTSPMDLPLYGKLKLNNTSKAELLGIWNEVLDKHQIQIEEHSKVERISQIGDYHFKLETSKGESVEARSVIIAIGRRGTPRKLGVPGEESSKVAYRLLEPEHIQGEKVLVVGGGDSAVESALLLADQNEVHLSYRKQHFARIKKGNQEKLEAALASGKILPLLSTNVRAIEEKSVSLEQADGSEITIENDRIYIFAGGELPIPFLKEAGISVEKTFGKTLKKH